MAACLLVSTSTIHALEEAAVGHPDSFAAASTDSVRADSGSGSTNSGAKGFDSLKSMVSHNSMGAAKTFGETFLATLDRNDPYRDSVKSVLAYLEHLMTRRTAPPRPPPSPWKLELDASLSWRSFQWKPGASEWSETVQTRLFPIPVNRYPSSHPEFPERTGRGASLRLGAQGAVNTASLRMSTSIDGKLELMEDQPRSTRLDGMVVGRFGIGCGPAELSITPFIQWQEGDLLAAGGLAGLDWRLGASDRFWTISLQVGETELPVFDQRFLSLGPSVEWTRRLGPHTFRSSLETQWSFRTPSFSREQPIRVAFCSGIHDGELADAAKLVCFESPESDSIAPLHPFKGLSGFPYRPGEALRQSTWSSSLRCGLSQLWRTESANRRWNLQVSGHYEVERSLQPVEWHNGGFGNSYGDSLIVLHDRPTNRDFLWESDFRGRFLTLERRREFALLQTGTIEARTGFFAIGHGELHLEGSISRTWSSLHAESGEYGRVQSQVGLGWNQTF